MKEVTVKNYFLYVPLKQLPKAIGVFKCYRWPLIIDPQGKATNWLKQRYREHMKSVNHSDQDFMTRIKKYMKKGTIVLLEKVGYDLDSSLNPILLKETFVQGIYSSRSS